MWLVVVLSTTYTQRLAAARYVRAAPVLVRALALWALALALSRSNKAGAGWYVPIWKFKFTASRPMSAHLHWSKKKPEARSQGQGQAGATWVAWADHIERAPFVNDSECALISCTRLLRRIAEDIGPVKSKQASKQQEATPAFISHQAPSSRRAQLCQCVV